MRFVLVLTLLVVMNPVLADGRTNLVTVNRGFNSFSLRGTAMACTGAALVDPQSFYYNPATLGLLVRQNRIVAASYLKRAKYADESSIHALSVAVPINYDFSGEEKLRIGAAFYKTRDTYERELTYPPGVSVESWSRTLNLVFAAGYEGKIDVGVGATLKEHRIKEGYDERAKGAADIGIILRVPFGRLVEGFRRRSITANVTAGASITNLGPGFDSWYYDQIQRRTRRLGISFDFGLSTQTSQGRWRTIVVTGTWENEKMKDLDAQSKLGVEFGLGEAAQIRMGNIDVNKLSTWGLSINSSGVIKSVTVLTGSTPSPLAKFLINKLSIEYIVAHSEEDNSVFPVETMKGIYLKVDPSIF